MKSEYTLICNFCGEVGTRNPTLAEAKQEAVCHLRMDGYKDQCKEVYIDQYGLLEGELTGKSWKMVRHPGKRKLSFSTVQLINN